PMFSQQWWLQPASGSNANAQVDRRRGVPGFLRAWQSGLVGSTGAAAARVAVLDTGITAHPDLAGRILPGYDFVSDSVYAGDGNGRDADPTDPGDGLTAAELADPAYRDLGCAARNSSWHGTLIAGLIAANTSNGVGVAGIHHDARIVPVRVAGKCGANLDDIIDGMRWAAGLAVAGAPVNAHPARIVNISFGGAASCGNAYQSAVNELRQHGVLVVAAAGNDAGAVSRPASCAGVVGVTALNRDGFKTHYANFGAALGVSGLATVGGDDAGGGAWGGRLADSGLLTVWNSGAQTPGNPVYANLFGTSFAAPLVAGAAALMLSVNPALTVEQLVAGLRASARPHVTSPWIGACSNANPGRCLCSAATCGAGILDAEQALRYAAQPASYVVPARLPEVIDNADVIAAAALGPDLPARAEPAVAEAASGGGALSAPWLAALALALWLLRPPRPLRTA
ncbi:MAG: S8 family serine peptidase, partial [Rubrivivax sp.]|nr:S8 family serine peptidase [Rubrivivax sp.]